MFASLNLAVERWKLEVAVYLPIIGPEYAVDVNEYSVVAIFDKDGKRGVGPPERRALAAIGTTHS
jgi:hypothetical protein